MSLLPAPGCDLGHTFITQLGVVPALLHRGSPWIRSVLCARAPGHANLLICFLYNVYLCIWYVCAFGHHPSICMCMRVDRMFVLGSSTSC